MASTERVWIPKCMKLLRKTKHTLVQNGDLISNSLVPKCQHFYFSGILTSNLINNRK